MLAWENPYRKGKDNRAKLLEKITFQVLHIDLAFICCHLSTFLYIALAAMFWLNAVRIHYIFSEADQENYLVKVKIWKCGNNQIYKCFGSIYSRRTG